MDEIRKYCLCRERQCAMVRDLDILSQAVSHRLLSNYLKDLLEKHKNDASLIGIDLWHLNIERHFQV